LKSNGNALIASSLKVGAAPDEDKKVHSTAGFKQGARIIAASTFYAHMPPLQTCEQH